MTTLLQDLRYATRVLVKKPAFTAVAVLSLALGIGANTTIFSIINAIFLHPLPVDDPASLVALYTTDEKNPGFLPTSYPNYTDYRDQGGTVFAGVAAYSWIPLNLASGGQPEQIFGQIVTGNYFALLGVRPAIRRAFLSEEDGAPGAHPVVVLSHGLWQQRFGGDPTSVGKTIEMNGTAFTVVGVAPQAFTGVDTGVRPELWVPTAMHERVFPNDRELFNERRFLGFSILARLKPGVSVEQAQAAARTFARRLERSFPKENAAAASRSRGLRRQRSTRTAAASSPSPAPC